MGSRVPLFKVFLPPKEVVLSALGDVLYSGQISEGPPVKMFEEKFELNFALRNCTSFYSGTAALHVALILAGVSKEDEVISTPMTAEPTNMAILHAGGKIVWADVDPRNGNVTAESIASKITLRTRAIVVVHYGGIPVPLGSIRAVAQSFNIPVIEDAAHALGAYYEGEPIGCHSDFVMFSFQAIKHMTTIDGGMLACHSSENKERARLVRWFGIDRAIERTSTDVSLVGYKYHMNNVNATLGLVQLDYIGKVIERHVANGRYFDTILREIPGLKICQWEDKARPSYWFYTVLADRREDLIRHLQAHGIEASTVHKRNDLHSVFVESRCSLPGLDVFSSKVVHIPCGWWVSDEDREYIVDVIKKGW